MKTKKPTERQQKLMLIRTINEVMERAMIDYKMIVAWDYVTDNSD